MERRKRNTHVARVMSCSILSPRQRLEKLRRQIRSAHMGHPHPVSNIDRNEDISSSFECIFGRGNNYPLCLLP